MADSPVSVNKNTVYNAIKSVFGVIYPLITFPYISRVLMAENVGKINFGNSIVSYYSLIASLGVTTYAVRECAKVKANQEQLNKIASQILSINIFSTGFAYLVLAVTLIVARSLDNYRLLICIQSSVILFTTLGADWLNTAMEDFRYITIRTVGMQVVSLVLMFMFVRKPDDYMFYAVISVVAASGANIINIFYRRKYCKTLFTFNLELNKHLKPIMLLFSFILAQTIYVNSDMTMLGLMKGDFEVGLYSTSVKIYTIVNTVVASVTWVVMPKLAAGFANKDYNKVNWHLRYALNYIIVLGLPCLVGMNVITKPLIYTLAGEEYLGASSSLHILSVSLLFSFIGGWIGNLMFLPAGRENICLRSSLICASINVILNLFLIPRFGLNAAAFTTAVSELMGIVVKYRYIDKQIRIKNIFGMIKGPVIGSILILIIGVVSNHFLESSYLISIITILLSIIAYTSTLIIMKNEFFIGFVNPVIKRIRGRKP